MVYFFSGFVLLPGLLDYCTGKLVFLSRQKGRCRYRRFLLITRSTGFSHFILLV